MLTLVFFIIALFYSTVGFGGGSSYLAVLAVSNIPYLLMPKLGLICNLMVVSGGCWHYYKKGHFNKRLILPFALSSVPMAFIGGMYPIKEETFMVVLSGSLFLAGLRLLFVAKPEEGKVKIPSMINSTIVGGALGLLSGIIALGGGIFLSPLMMNLKWGRPKEVAATASAFIFLNSSAGLAGQLTKGMPQEIIEYWPLLLAVFLGGQIGSRFGTSQLTSHAMVQRGTGILILIISSRLLYQLALY